MKHFAFPNIEEISEWKNVYTGKTNQISNDTIECEKSVNLNYSQNKSGIERRNEFLNPKEKNKKNNEENSEEGEIEIPSSIKSATLRKNQINSALKLSGYGEHSANEGNGISSRETTLFSNNHRPQSLQASQIKNDLSQQEKQFVISSGEKNTQQEFVAQLKESQLQLDDDFHLKRDKEIARNIAIQLSEEDKDVDLSDLMVLREIQQTHNYKAHENTQQKISSLDLTLDILGFNMSSGNTAVANCLQNECADLASKMKNSLLKYSTQTMPVSFLGQMRQSNQTGTENNNKQSIVTDNFSGRNEILSSDIQFALKRSLNIDSWKNDAVEQERAGTWALEVVAKKVGASSKNVLSSLKTDSLRALGRLTLQSLHTIVGKQSKADLIQNNDAHLIHTVSIKRQTENQPATSSKLNLKDQKNSLELDDSTEKVFLDLSNFKSKINQIVNLRELLKHETFREDLQCVQDGLQLEKTADEIFETFLETLRDELVDSNDAKVRHDILSGITNASETILLDEKFKNENYKITMSQNKDPNINLPNKTKLFLNKVKHDYQTEEMKTVHVQDLKAVQEEEDIVNNFNSKRSQKLNNQIDKGFKEGFYMNSNQEKSKNRKIETSVNL